MSIFDDVSRQMKEAMRAREQTRVQALRNIRASFLTEMKRDGSDTLSDEACVVVLRRLAKQRGESIAAFEDGGRPERAAAEREELAVVEAFLPSLADDAQTRAWVEEAIAVSGASSARDIGRVMGALMKAHKGEVDGGLAKRITGELLAQPEESD
jgi:uncharacterized protein YqeY